jgi:predicted DNA-binding protein (UPF0251 family)
MAEIKLSDGRVIKMRKPKVRDMRMVADVENDIEKEIKLISNLTNMTVEELDELDLVDYKKLQDALADFLS